VLDGGAGEGAGEGMELVRVGGHGCCPIS
jgi:hypothetical protein